MKLFYTSSDCVCWIQNCKNNHLKIIISEFSQWYVIPIIYNNSKSEGFFKFSDMYKEFICYFFVCGKKKLEKMLNELIAYTVLAHN